MILWGPTPATRQLAYILGFIVLIALGVYALRRQTAMEFPDAQPGDAMRSVRAWSAQRRERPAPAEPVAAATNGSHVDELERLAKLHNDGALTDAEFKAEKAALTAGS